jgi:hypothetical protein
MNFQNERTVSHYYAFVTDFLEFEHIVPFRQDGKYLEDALMNLPFAQIWS